jgi:methylmalonyl-CoA mutase
VYDEGRRIVEEVESMGGMAAAVASGWPKLKIEECAAKRQANIDSGKEVIVGVNKYKLDTEDKIDVLVIDNQEVKAKQLARLEQVGTCYLTGEIEYVLSTTLDSSTACFYSSSYVLHLQQILMSNRFPLFALNSGEFSKNISFV